MRLTTPVTLYALMRSSSSGISSSRYRFVVIMPFIVPLSLSMRVKARVSMPEIPATLYFFMKFCMVFCDLKFDGIRENSRAMKPSSHGSLDSVSA